MFLSIMYSHVRNEIGTVWKWFVTLNTINIFSSLHVFILELGWTVWKSLITLGALKRFLSSVWSHMRSEIRNVWKWLVTFGAYKMFFLQCKLLYKIQDHTRSLISCRIQGTYDFHTKCTQKVSHQYVFLYENWDCACALILYYI